jgi:hypothetical protein
VLDRVLDDLADGPLVEPDGQPSGDVMHDDGEVRRALSVELVAVEGDWT